MSMTSRDGSGAGIGTAVSALVSMAIRRDPKERASDRDLLTRWQETGRRTLCSPLALIVAGLTLFAMTANFLPTAGGAVAGLVVGILGMAAITWFLPVAYTQSWPIENVPTGAFVLVNGNTVLPEASAVIAAGEMDAGSGTDRYLGLQSGQAHARSSRATVDVVRMFDPFRRWRTPSPADEAPSDVAPWFPYLLEGVRTTAAYEGSTLNHSAPKADVERALADLAPAHLTTQDSDLLVARAKGMGLLQRFGTPSDRLRLSDAGVVWHQVIMQSDLAVDTGSEPYDALRQELKEFLAEIRSTAAATEIRQEDLPAWVRGLVDKFKQVVESTGAYNALWTPTGEPQNETGVQAFAQAVFQSYCESADVDMTRESNAGDGPVDFKFSQGWRARALIEVKLLRSTRLAHGAQYQLPGYLQAESVDCGFYLCVGFTDSDFHPRRRERVITACADASRQSGLKITPVFVDARRRTSASRR